MKVLKKGCVRKLAVKRDPYLKRIAGGPRPLVTQRCLESVKAKKAAFGTPPLPTTGTEVARMRLVWSQVMVAVMEIKLCTCVFVLLDICSHMSSY